MAITLNQTQLTALKAALKQAAFPPAKVTRLLWRVAKYGVIAAVKRQVKNQIDVRGRGFTPRKTKDEKKQRKKMLTQLPQLLAIKTLNEQSAVRLYFSSRRKTSRSTLSAGGLGTIHQAGRTFTAYKAQFSQFKDKDGKTQQQKSADAPTPRQVKTLRQLNYCVPGRNKKAPAHWIREHLTRGQAGIIIKAMRQQASKAQWSIVLPSREFFGISDSDFEKSLARELSNIHRGFNVKAQQMKNKK